MKIKERIEEIRGNINRYNIPKAISEIRELSEEYRNYEILDDVIDTEYLKDMVKRRLEDSGWQGVAFMLSDINSFNDEYYKIDGYGNIKDFRKSDCEIIVDELESYLQEEIEEEEKEE